MSDARTRQLIQTVVTFRTPQILPREAAIRYRTGAQGFRKVARTTYERTVRFRAHEEDLLNLTIPLVHEIYDIARQFGLTKFVIVRIESEVLARTPQA